MTDIVRTIINRAKQRIAESYGLPPEVDQVLRNLEVEIKTEFKGERVYIPAPHARTALSARPEQVAQDYVNNVQVEDIASRHGISRATIYRYLKRR